MTCQTLQRALIVAHGQPSDPAPAEAELRVLADAVSACLPSGWRVDSATLASPDALALALSPPDPAGLVYPMFMAQGWFTRRHLPDRLAQAGGASWQVMAPFGCDPLVQDLTLTLIREALAENPAAALQAQVLLAAHGSSRSSGPADVANLMADRIAREAGVGRAEAAFIDQSPRIVEAARNFTRHALCLPYFAARGGHVIDDLPAALAEAGFSGTLLDPVGADSRVPALIAGSLLKAASQT